jgi:transcriptional regulator with XRE-family HTH domain
MIDRKIFSKRLKELRDHRKLTMVDVARTLEISKQSIHQWEAMKTVPSSDKLVELADILGCSLDYLVGRTYGSSDTSEV